MVGYSCEKRPLKKPRLGPPDVYPQDPRQREDELTAVNVKQGYAHVPITDEFGSARNNTISAAKLGQFINGTITRRHEANTFPDTGKRRIQVNTKDHFWHVTPRVKQTLEAWMKDLAGSKPLSALAKKVPIFNKREDIFFTLAEHQVPLTRATWFIRMTASYNSAISEAKTKKRLLPDPSQEWTISLARCCKDILTRETMGAGASSSSFGSSSTATQNASDSPTSGQNSLPNSNPSSGTNRLPGQSVASPSPADDGSVCLRQWTYCIDLAKHLYEEGLLDRYEWLQCVVGMCENTESLDDHAWKNLIPLILSYSSDISQSEFLARRLASVAARRFSGIFTDQDFPSYVASGGPDIPPPSGLIERLQCPTHRSTVLGLASTLQTITLECPTAMVYNNNPAASVEVGRTSIPPGSAMDILPIQPSVLPMPPRANNHIIRAQIRRSENQIVMRSKAVESNWSCKEWQQSSADQTLRKVLHALDILDRYSFDKLDGTNCIESLYSQVFTEPPDKENWEADAPIVLLLCQWAVGPQRTGEHRALAVARLLEHRQTDIFNAGDPSASNNNSDSTKQNDPNSSENGKNPEDDDGLGAALNGTDGGPDSASNTNNQGSGGSSSVSSNSNNGGNVNNSYAEMNGEESNTGMDEDNNDTSFSGFPIFHNLLFKFLDSDGPILGIDEGSLQGKITFASLVHLFSVFIRHDIFSHDAYLRTLVARGDLSTIPSSSNSVNNNMAATPGSVPPIQNAATPGPGPASHPGPGTPASVQSATPGATPHHDSMEERGPLFQPLPRLPEMPKQTDYDDKNIDDDLDRILQHITQEQQMDQVDSPKDDSGGGSGFGSMTPNHHSQVQQSGAPGSGSEHGSNSYNNPGSVGGPNSNNGSRKGSNGGPGPGETLTKQARHRLFVTHFPLPQDDSYQHEANQRQILLYGVGRSRDEAKHMVKKVSKDLNKLFSKKFCYDIADGSRVKKQSRNELNLDSLQARFSSLPYFDQHAVTSQMALSAIEMISAFANGRGSYLPTVEHIALLTELMETSLNIDGLVDTCSQLVKDLHEVENQLVQRNSPIAASYSTSLQLQLVAVLRRYHCCLLLDSESTSAVWESMVRYMRRITSSCETTSADRCTLAYMMELHTSVGFLRTKVFADIMSPTALKLQKSLSSRVQPSKSSLTLDNGFMTQCLDNPKRKVDPAILRQLQDNPVCRYSFVCNAILSICNEADGERLNDLASLCADMTAACPSLASEWLGVFQSLCNPSRHIASYTDVLKEVDVKHLDIHSNLATLTAILVARQCFSLQDFVVQAVPSLLKAWNEGHGPHDPDTEAEARLTCHLLLSLFKTQETGTNSQNAPCTLRLSCDRRLLSATHNSITLGAVLAVLKAMLLLADAAGSGERRRDQRTLPGMSGELSIILGTSDVVPPSERSDSIRGENRTLASFAYTALQQMCREPWVRQRCLQSPEDLCNSDMLLDPIVSPKQALRLLHLICYPDMVQDESLDARVQIPKVLERLNQWNLREAWLALTVQNKQLQSSSMEYQSWLDIVARSCLDIFHLGGEEGQEYTLSLSSTPSPAPGKSPRSGKKTQSNSQQESMLISKSSPGASSLAGTSGSANNAGTGSNSCGSGPSNLNNGNNSSTLVTGGIGINGQWRGDDNGFGNGNDRSEACEFDNYFRWTTSASWLIAPLVSKLSPAVQGRVLRHAGNVLESNLWPKALGKPKSTPPLSNNMSKGSNGTANGYTLQSQLPFLALILTCLKGQDEQRENLLASLLNQLNQLLALAKDPLNLEVKSVPVRDALRLRLSLVGGMFDAIHRSSTATVDWAVALTQLVTHGIVDLYNNCDVFYTVVDMVAALVHSTQIPEPGDRIEEMKKQNINLIKKLKKELADRDSDSIKPLRQLLPFSKQVTEIVVCQSNTLIIDSKGNKVTSLEFVDKKQGLKVWEKQRVSAWELLEGQKNPAPMSWAWFGAVRMEKKLLRYDDAFNRLKFHSHHAVKPISHFMEPVPLPEEDIDMIPDIKEDIKPETPCSDQSPRGGPLTPIMGGMGSTKKPKAPRKKRQTKAMVAAAALGAGVPSQPTGGPPPNMGGHVGPGGPGTMPTHYNQTGGPPPNQIAPGPAGQQQQNYPPGPPPQWHSGGHVPSYYPGPGGGRPPPPQQMANSKQALQTLLRARTTAPIGPNPNQFQQFQNQNPQRQQQQTILQQQLRGQGPAQMQQRFQAQGMNQNPNMVYQQQQQMQSQAGMNTTYRYNQTQIGSQGGPGQGINPQQHQMMNTRGQMSGDMNYMGSNQHQGPGQMRPTMNRPFMQGNPGGTVMTGNFNRPPNMGQMNPNQMNQSMMSGMGQQQGMQSGGPNMSQMSQMSGSQIGQQGMMPNPSQMQNPRMSQSQYMMQQQQANMGPGPRMQHYPNQAGGY